jgi:hypothetical protein
MISFKLKTRMSTRQSGFFAIYTRLTQSHPIATRYRHFWRYLKQPINTYRQDGICNGIDRHLRKTSKAS